MGTERTDAHAAALSAKTGCRSGGRGKPNAASQRTLPEQSFKQATDGQNQSGHSLHRSRTGKMRDLSAVQPLGKSDRKLRFASTARKGLEGLLVIRRGREVNSIEAVERSFACGKTD